MTDPFDDLSPSLGGDRAIPEPEPEPAEPGGPEPGSPRFEGFGPGELPPEFERLFAELGEGPELEAFMRSVGQMAQLSEGFAAIMGEALEVVEQRLPATLNAFEGLFGALGEALGPLFRDEPPRAP